MSMRQRLKKGSTEPAVLEDVSSDGEGSSSGSGSDSGGSESDSGSDDDKISGAKDSVKVQKGAKGVGKGKKGTAAPQAGYNWSAVCILVLFMAIPLFTGFQYLYDYLNPSAAQSRQVYSNLYRCYNAIGDQEKIAKIDYNVERYKGRERMCPFLSLSCGCDSVCYNCTNLSFLFPFPSLFRYSVHTVKNEIWRGIS